MVIFYGYNKIYKLYLLFTEEMAQECHLFVFLQVMCMFHHIIPCVGLCKIAGKGHKNLATLGKQSILLEPVQNLKISISVKYQMFYADWITIYGSSYYVAQHLKMSSDFWKTLSISNKFTPKLFFKIEALESDLGLLSQFRKKLL